MSKNINGIAFIFEEKDDICEECGKIAELRPYGKNGAKICFECGMKNEKEIEKNMSRILFDID